MRLQGPNPRLGLAILRVVLGVTFVAHGSPKLFQGGVGGLGGMLGQIGVPLPDVVAWLVALTEFFGGVALIVGLVVTPVALLLSLHMLMGIILVHAPAGWYVLGSQAQHPPGGVEFNVLLIAGLLTLVLAGPGAAALGRRREEPGPGEVGPEAAPGGAGGAGAGLSGPGGGGAAPPGPGEGTGPSESDRFGRGDDGGDDPLDEPER